MPEFEAQHWHNVGEQHGKSGCNNAGKYQLEFNFGLVTFQFANTNEDIRQKGVQQNDHSWRQKVGLEAAQPFRFRQFIECDVGAGGRKEDAGNGTGYDSQGGDAQQYAYDD